MAEAAGVNSCSDDKSHDEKIPKFSEISVSIMEPLCSLPCHHSAAPTTEMEIKDNLCYDSCAEYLDVPGRTSSCEVLSHKNTAGWCSNTSECVKSNEACHVDTMFLCTPRTGHDFSSLGWQSPGSESASEGFASRGSSSRDNSLDLLTAGAVNGRDRCPTPSSDASLSAAARKNATIGLSCYSRKYPQSSTSGQFVASPGEASNAQPPSPTVRFSPAVESRDSSDSLDDRFRRSNTPSSVRSSPFDRVIHGSAETPKSSDYSETYRGGSLSPVLAVSRAHCYEAKKPGGGTEDGLYTGSGTSTTGSIFTYSLNDYCVDGAEALLTGGRSQDEGVEMGFDGRESRDGDRPFEGRSEGRVAEKKRVINVEYNHVVTFRLSDLQKFRDALMREAMNPEKVANRPVLKNGGKNMGTGGKSLGKSSNDGKKKTFSGRRSLRDFLKAMSPTAHRKKCSDTSDDSQSSTSSNSQTRVKSVDCLAEEKEREDGAMSSLGVRGRYHAKGSGGGNRGKSVDCLIADVEGKENFVDVRFDRGSGKKSSGMMHKDKKLASLDAVNHSSNHVKLARDHSERTKNTITSELKNSNKIDSKKNIKDISKSFENVERKTEFLSQGNGFETVSPNSDGKKLTACDSYSCEQVEQKSNCLMPCKPFVSAGKSFDCLMTVNGNEPLPNNTNAKVFSSEVKLTKANDSFSKRARFFEECASFDGGQRPGANKQSTV